ncbi:DUF5018 domain-containing protein [Marinigracilibium pacificum]|uniref:DUF5018 domain-containing protein n=1 Tax=Marinigracilibium pacificum TaxID=2729599 RepID=A0A848IS01_9BACT|nr:DUF5018 domain-containing protein [Marinigracilibium pacificum]NMM47127.1 hypothetical protein [Marinigracilibium pacificum]
MKKLINSILAFALIAGFLTLQSCDDDETQSSAKDITSFVFAGLNPQVDGQISGTSITASVFPGTDVTALVPTIAVSSGASVDPASGVAQDFTSPVTYTVKAEDGSTKSYTVTVSEASEVTYMGGTYTDDDFIAGITYNLVAGEDYLFDGLVFIEAGATLNVPAGTTVKFKNAPTTGDNTSSLIIARDAMIMAEGTSSNPIVFTAELDDDNEGVLTPSDNAQWGGLIMLGNAPAYKDGITDGIAIEGIDSEEVRGQYGGNDANDNSGVLKYVSIRYTGIGLAAGDEIQGLTLGGVGAGTVIDYIDIFSTADDGIEIFGGTVNIKHIAVAFSTDDDFDFDLGWRGNAQFLFTLMRNDVEGYDHAGEWDGADPDDAPLFSAPNVFNYTAIGPGQNATGRQRAFLMRENFAGKLGNSVIVDFPGYAMEIQNLTGTNQDSYGKITTPVDGYQLEILNNTWSAIKKYDGSTVASVVEPSDDTEISDVVAELTDNNNKISSSPIVSITRGSGVSDVTVDPRPTSNDDEVATVPSGMEQVNYRGAFAAGEATWLAGWSALSKFGYVTE